MATLNLSPSEVIDVLKSERPTRDGTRWADGARDEWSKARDVAFSAEAFVRSCGME